jgi:hypothetical protein
MTPQRAREIMEHCRYKDGFCGMIGRPAPTSPPPTDEEDQHIRRIWKAMPGWATYYNALGVIIAAEVAAKLPMFDARPKP